MPRINGGPRKFGVRSIVQNIRSKRWGTVVSWERGAWHVLVRLASQQKTRSKYRRLVTWKLENLRHVR